jgi:type IV secretion system protein VirB10
VSSPADSEAVVRGERSDALVNAVRSVQSRVSSVLAAALMTALGLSALTWYYAHALTRASHARAAAQSTAVSRARGEMSLPALGPIVPPPLAAPPAAAPGPDAAGVPPVQPSGDMPLEETRAVSAWPPRGPGVAMAGNSAPPTGSQVIKSAAELSLERRLSGAVFTREPDSATTTVAQGTVAAPVTSAAHDAGAQVSGAATGEGAGERSDGALAALLKPPTSAAVQAQLLPTARLMLPRGAFIDCTLETAIDSTLPGMTTCVTAADTFSADGKVVLLERGTKLVGETRGQVRQGQARVFVVWTEARTPAGVVVPLDSPGTDELGRSGLPGQVQRHFWERFGAAILVSIVNGAVQAGVQASNRSGGAVIYAPSASQDVMTEVLKDTIDIPPTVTKRNGDRIQVLVARDLDFRSVYELRTSATGR